MSHFDSAIGTVVLLACLAFALVYAHPAAAAKCRDDSFNRSRNSFVVSLADRPVAQVPSGTPWVGCGSPNFQRGNRLDKFNTRKAVRV